jgi:hypothetical protein
MAVLTPDVLLIKKSSANKTDKGGAFPKRNDSKGDSRKFGGDSSSSKKVGWKKPFTENSGPPKSEFGNRKTRRDETPGSEKRSSSRGGRYSKPDNESRGKRDESSRPEKRYSSRGGRYSKPDNESRGKRDDPLGREKVFLRRGPLFKT